MTATTVARPAIIAPRPDLELICSLVYERASVLDLGCGDGTLMELLALRRGCRATGIEISEESIYACIGRGLPVHHADLDAGLGDYADASYDYVILSQTLQAVRRPRAILQDMLRVGRRGVVSVPNFGNWRVRWSLLRTGRMPKTPELPYEWFDTPNIHLATVRDFEDLCRRDGIEISRAVYLAGGKPLRRWPNLRAEIALFVIRKAGRGD